MSDKRYRQARAGEHAHDAITASATSALVEDARGALGWENSVQQERLNASARSGQELGDAGSQLAFFPPIFVLPEQYPIPRCTNANDKYSPQEISALTLATQTMNADQLSKGQNAVLSTEMMLNLYDAEDKRRTFWGDDVGEFFGAASSYGNGQLTEPMMKDVMTKCGPQMQQFIAQWNKANPNSPISTPDLKNWKNLAEDEVWGAFFTSAGLQLKIDASEKEGRSQEDATRFGIGKYHGGQNMLSEVQKKVGDEVNWAPVGSHLERGTEAQQDMNQYIEEVMQPRQPIECTGGPSLVA